MPLSKLYSIPRILFEPQFLNHVLARSKQGEKGQRQKHENYDEK